jgi:hypothetical protein
MLEREEDQAIERCRISGTILMVWERLIAAVVAAAAATAAAAASASEVSCTHSQPVDRVFFFLP